MHGLCNSHLKIICFPPKVYTINKVTNTRSKQGQTSVTDDCAVWQATSSVLTRDCILTAKYLTCARRRQRGINLSHSFFVQLGRYLTSSLLFNSSIDGGSKKILKGGWWNGHLQS